MINKIKGAGLDFTDYRSKPSLLERPEYVHLDIRSNNSYLFENVITEETQVCCTAEFHEGLFDGIEGLLSEIGRSWVEVLLISGEITNTEPLLRLLEAGYVKDIGVSCPPSPEHLKKTTDKIKEVIIPKHVSLNISPVYFPWSILKEAEEEELEVIGLNPFGDRISKTATIDSFGIPYLLGFAARYSDIVFTDEEENLDYLSALIGKELGPEYELTKDTNHLFKPYKRMIYSSITPSPELIVPYDAQTYIFNPSELTLGFSPGRLQVPEDENYPPLISKVLEGFYGYLELLNPYTEGTGIENYMSCIRPKVKGLISSILGSVWKVETVNLGKTVFVFRATTEIVERRFLRRAKTRIETLNFLLASGQDNKLELAYLPN
ncbi:MAG: hypothetical protein J6I84_02635 [Bacilli bacterium]|nr:hypothetical protein [Bacilli bacterium]